MSGLFPGAGIRVVPEGIRAFGTTNLHAAESVAHAGAIDLHANIASLSPALGLIGAEFLGVFGAAQSEHTRAVGQLALAYGSCGIAAHEAAAGYESADVTTATALSQATGAL
ncbi:MULTISPECIES: type VII secretion target [unclassified Rhodococcus (in: high G+C Gram-positive bacteria)]|jgi:hypothetical protein|uniref:type VII secretion target n=1 Tax=unclassified Rhodococcus (in: high G+C Gram-positive bacteria) TaxID=192944 RepID=UPI00146E08B5|nr:MULTISPECIES: type VII secretion target [unclassified Rhodococcus (in: high G+C Gram-positive bacteria)]MBF0660729.1 hypothetical protein [Rhodococcus sp. (in: high G+C Gram-positive bacteria)]NMD96466.1 hypothetical protein [Rhodococcus sp. BL-253-APC-6A1W]NME79395.1 hypothetical protein [Rhodococcus sp. 105337]